MRRGRFTYEAYSSWYLTPNEFNLSTFIYKNLLFIKTCISWLKSEAWKSVKLPNFTAQITSLCQNNTSLKISCTLITVNFCPHNYLHFIQNSSANQTKTLPIIPPPVHYCLCNMLKEYVYI